MSSDSVVASLGARGESFSPPPGLSFLVVGVI